MIIGLLFTGNMPPHASSWKRLFAFRLPVFNALELRILPNRNAIPFHGLHASSHHLRQLYNLWHKWFSQGSRLHKPGGACILLRSFLPPNVSWFELGICYKDNTTDFVCSSNAINPPSLDPLMLIEFARTLTNSVVFPPILTISVVLSGVAFFLTLILFSPVVFNWRHARNIHFLCIASSAGATFFLFVTSLMTTFAISAVMSAIPTVSLQVIATERGILLEAFIWAAFGIWMLSFLWTWWLRWWEILERREIKRA